MTTDDITQQIPYPEPPAEPPASRRPLKVAHLVMGLFFLGFVAMATSLNTGAIPWSGARYLWPALLVAVGAVGLLATLLSNRRRVRRPATLPD